MVVGGGRFANTTAGLNSELPVGRFVTTGNKLRPIYNMGCRNGCMAYSEGWEVDHG